MRRIRSRDRHAAAKISDARRQHPSAVIVVLFGESHLAPQHLPKLIRQNLPGDCLLTVLQNVDALYWKAVGENAGAVSISQDAVCVFNSSPLEKYESYRLCLERWNSDDHTDFAPAVYNVIFSLARTLGFRLDSPHNGTQPKYLADSLPEVVNVLEATMQDFEPFAGEGARATQSRAAQAIDTGGCYYLPERNQFFIREFNMPQVAAEAARFLRHACRGMEQSANSSALEAALARFGARLLCPEAAGDPAASVDGDELYQSYVSGKLSRAAVRKMFLKN